MGPLPEICDKAAEYATIRRHIHAHPELGFEEWTTSELVADRLSGLGIPVTRGLGRTGVVATIRHGSGSTAIALRADMDALPMQEHNEFEHRSRIDGRFHGCGHDGHTAMLLLAAGYLADNPCFDGKVHLIFQPAEEGLGGARAMIEDGLFERFPCQAVFGMHNWPGLAAGYFAVRSGAFLAASDTFDVTISGVGGHAAFPELTNSPINAAARLCSALEALRRAVAGHDPPTILSLTQIHAGSAYNVIPEQAVIRGSVRNRDEAAQDRVAMAVRQLIDEVAQDTSTTMKLDYARRYPVLINSERETAQAVSAARRVAGEAGVNADAAFINGSEDFAFMLQQRPGCYMTIGAGDAPGLPFCHHPKYDFNDDILPIGATFWVELVRMLLGRGE